MDIFLDYLLAVLIGIVISFVISFFAYKKRSLAKSGFIAAMIMGTIIYALGGYYFMFVLLTFFISSSLLSKLHKGDKKDSLRTYKQVLANGLIGTILVILYYMFDDEIYKILYTISFAVATADTWAGEIGVFAKKPPRYIITGKIVEPGVSGGITLIGTLASLAGSIVISAFYIFNYQVILWGFLGSVVDSLLGTIQIKYVTETGRILDQPIDSEQTISTKGLSFVSNNLVNFVSNFIVILFAYIFMVL